MTLEITLIPALTDNYVYLLRDVATGKTAVVDPTEAQVVERELGRQSLGLDFIINTHHHWDHVGGNAELKKRYDCKVLGPAADKERIATMDWGLGDGDRFQLGSRPCEVLFLPGHTAGHIALWFEEDQALFCGDTLFSLGCGRLFEGSPEQMWASLSRLAALPAETKIYCAHEYTEANGRFALTVDPENRALQDRMAEVRRLRATGASTLPSTIGQEKATNPFLRAGSAVKFAELRSAKDRFRG